MSAETITRTIQLIVAPVVMLSACAIFVGGFLAHYEAINARMRTIVRELLELLRTEAEKERLFALALALELRTSQRAVAFEVERVLRLRQEPAVVTRDVVSETALS
jgi:hypothetical protein